MSSKSSDIGALSDLGGLVADRLRLRILSGAIRPGARLVESGVAQEFGTSRGPVRDAITLLEASGLVSVVPRRGAYVVRLGVADLAEIYSLRIALETLAIERASSQAGPPDWTLMLDALDGLDRALESQQFLEAATADMQFHRLIVLAARHDRLLRSWDAFSDQTVLVLRELGETDPGVQASARFHMPILDALRSRDATLASALLREHLTEAQLSLTHKLDGRSNV